jgi:hypothetical protein
MGEGTWLKAVHVVDSTLMRQAYSPLESEFDSPQAESDYEAWLRAKVMISLAQADDPTTPRYSTDEIRRRVSTVIESHTAAPASKQ